MQGHTEVALGSTGCERQALWYQEGEVLPGSLGKMGLTCLNNSVDWQGTETCYSGRSRPFAWAP